MQKELWQLPTANIASGPNCQHHRCGRCNMCSFGDRTHRCIVGQNKAAEPHFLAVMCPIRLPVQEHGPRYRPVMHFLS